MLLAQGKTLPYLGGPKDFYYNGFLFPPPAAAREFQHNLWQQFFFPIGRIIWTSCQMKAKNLLKFDKLVLRRIRVLLALLQRVSVPEDKWKILHATSELDDADLNELSFALRRIEKGTYGQCVICRHDIPSAILELNLTAKLFPLCQLEMQEKIGNSVIEGHTSE